MGKKSHTWQIIWLFENMFFVWIQRMRRTIQWENINKAQKHSPDKPIQMHEYIKMNQWKKMYAAFLLNHLK